MNSRRSGRLSFWVKPPLVVALVALADVFFYGGHMGSTLGAFALALLGAAALTLPAVRRDLRARWALAFAALFSLMLFLAPSAVGWLFYWIALGVAVLSPRASRGVDAVSWLKRLSYLAWAGAIGPARDLLRLRRHLGFPDGAAPRLLAITALPIIGAALFVSLFASANPVISQVLAGLRLPTFDFVRLGFWLFCLVGFWSVLRPRFLLRRPSGPAIPHDRPLPGISVASVGLSLFVFNTLFAIQNGLDIAFLWSGAALPKGLTLADYAHRGAYPLILTAILAGVFVLVALRPGSATARPPWLRRLVVAWVVQNVFLVASSILRTLDYVQAYSLTRLRIAALLWMGLVAAGLVLICWRMLRGKSSAWLVNANVLTAGAVLAACSVVDLGAVAAQWNVGHAREAGGDGPPLDLCYLGSLDASSIVIPLSELENRPLSPAFRDRVSWVRTSALAAMISQQAKWRDWTWRVQRRLDRATAIYPAFPPARADLADARNCDGGRALSPPVAPGADSR